jgi:hypothetical protein
VNGTDDVAVAVLCRLPAPITTVNAVEVDLEPQQPQELQPLASKNTRKRRTEKRENSAPGNADLNWKGNANERMSETVVVELPDPLHEPNLEVVLGSATMTMMTDAHAHPPWPLVVQVSHLILWILLLHLEPLIPIFRITIVNINHMFLKTIRAILLHLLAPLVGCQLDLRRQDLLGHHHHLDLRDLHHLVAQDRLTICTRFV